jgi:hypothetical protein
MGKLLLVLYKEIREYGIFGMQLFSRNVSNGQINLVAMIETPDHHTVVCAYVTLEFFFKILAMQIAWIFVEYTIWKSNSHTIRDLIININAQHNVRIIIAITRRKGRPEFNFH